jgi:hypothetical protein
MATDADASEPSREPWVERFFTLRCGREMAEFLATNHHHDKR